MTLSPLNLSEDELSLLSRKLVYARWLYEKGVEQAGNDDELSSLLAICHFHNAVEIVVQNILVTRNWMNTDPKNMSFVNFLNLIDCKGTRDTKTPPYVPRRQELLNLCDMRNQILHHGKRFHLEETEKARKICRLFLQDAVETFLSISIDQISMATLIRDEWARTRMLEAEKLFRNSELQPALAEAAKVVYRLEISVGRTLNPSRHFTSFNLPRDTSRFGFHGGDKSPLQQRITKLEEYTKSVTKGFAEINDQMEKTESRMVRLTFVSLVDPLGATRFFKIAPFVTQTLRGREGVANFIIQTRRDAANLTGGEVDRAIDFAVSSALKIESKGLGAYVNPDREPDGQ